MTLLHMGSGLSSLRRRTTDRLPSQTLTPSEQNYTEIEKEAFSIVYGVKNFHKYLYEREIQLLTDNKPLLVILGPKSGVPTLAALRMQRWALILLTYDYTIEYRHAWRRWKVFIIIMRLGLPLPLQRSFKLLQSSNMY